LAVNWLVRDILKDRLIPIVVKAIPHLRLIIDWSGGHLSRLRSWTNALLRDYLRRPVFFVPNFWQMYLTPEEDAVWPNFLQDWPVLIAAWALKAKEGTSKVIMRNTAKNLPLDFIAIF